ncbi:hypothetical protein GTY68_23040 [Streptomyces sp. SID4926]|nr:hypothetical protein [Streptomyces sp. SID4926]SCD98411.1 hypothetical protein GA0115252_126213 [Streptomyces sp. DfronAA-171]
MRDVIARALCRVLALLFPATGGRRRLDRPVTPAPAPLSVPAEPSPSPWSRPWEGPASWEVRRVFRDERLCALPEPQRERAYAAALAGLGVDYGEPTMPLASLIRREAVAA